MNGIFGIIRAMGTGGFSLPVSLPVRVVFGAMFIGGGAIADDAVGIMRIAVPSNGETAVAMPFEPFGVGLPESLLAGPFADDGDDGSDMLHYDDRMITYIHNMTNHHPYAIISPDGGRTDFTYDGEGYISRIDADEMPYISMTRDLLGHVNSITRPGPDGARTTSITNNWRGKPLSIDYPDGTSETFAYNGNGTRVVRHFYLLQGL